MTKEEIRQKYMLMQDAEWGFCPVLIEPYPEGQEPPTWQEVRAAYAEAGVVVYRGRTE